MYLTFVFASSTAETKSSSCPDVRKLQLLDLPEDLLCLCLTFLGGVKERVALISACKTLQRLCRKRSSWPKTLDLAEIQCKHLVHVARLVALDGKPLSLDTIRFGHIEDRDVGDLTTLLRMSRPDAGPLFLTVGVMACLLGCLRGFFLISSTQAQLSVSPA